MRIVLPLCYTLSATCSFKWGLNICRGLNRYKTCSCSLWYCILREGATIYYSYLRCCLLEAAHVTATAIVKIIIILQRVTLLKHASVLLAVSWPPLDLHLLPAIPCKAVFYVFNLALWHIIEFGFCRVLSRTHSSSRKNPRMETFTRQLSWGNLGTALIKVNFITEESFNSLFQLWNNFRY